MRAIVVRRHTPFAIVILAHHQQGAGAFMWVAITFLYLVPALVFTIRALSPEQQAA